MRTKICGIYKIENMVNKKCYVGSAIDVIKRWNLHKYDLYKNKHHSRYFQRAWKKYGECCFKFEIIETILIKDKYYILEREQYWLDYYKSYKRKFGYNICIKSGNRMGMKHTEESKKKIGNAERGEKNHNFNKPMSEEIKNKIREKRKMQIITEETKKKISKANKGREISIETRKKISRVSMGNKKGAKLTWEQVKEIREKYKTRKYISKELAIEYGVTGRSINNIAGNRTWKEK